MWRELPAAPDPHVVARTETRLAFAEVTDIDLGALAFLAGRFEQRLSMIDAAEPAQRAELEHLMAIDFAELAEAYTQLAWMVERGGEA